MKAFLVSVFASLVFLSGCAGATGQTVTRVVIAGTFQEGLTKCVLSATPQTPYTECADAVSAAFGVPSADAGADR